MTKTHTLKDLEKMLNIKERTLFRYLKKGLLTGSKVGKWRFTDNDIKNFLNKGRKNK
jgi:predicted site-specific integrase-resolvase